MVRFYWMEIGATATDPALLITLFPEKRLDTAGQPRG